jgi:hypothetical protein
LRPLVFVVVALFATPASAGVSGERGLYWRHWHRAVLMPLSPEYQTRTLYLRTEASATSLCGPHHVEVLTRLGEPSCVVRLQERGRAPKQLPLRRVELGLR